MKHDEESPETKEDILHLKSSLAQIKDAIDKSENDAAISGCHELYQKFKTWPLDRTSNLVLAIYYDLGCQYVDVGSITMDEELIRKGLEIWNENEEDNAKIFSRTTLEYNKGNALSGIFSIELEVKNGFYSPSDAQHGIDAKNAYWRAFKNLEEPSESLRAQLLCNLANQLNTSGRIAEALEYFDRALQSDPFLPQAHSGRARCLAWYSRTTRVQTMYLLAEVYLSYKSALNSPSSHSVNSTTKRGWAEEIEKLGTWLNEQQYDFRTEQHVDKEQEVEFDSHCEYHKFSLRHHLVLSEHSLYCWCNGAGADNISIPGTVGVVGGFEVAQMELVLNRCKAEFGFARHLFYQYSVEDMGANAVIDDLSHYIELFNNEVLGVRIEQLKMVCRISFGILDKIARAVCELYELASKKENVYFESFWKNSKDRWDKIAEINNIGLNGLHSIATDLNTKNGEWSRFKHWRNSLEHGVFIVLASEEPDDLYRSMEFKEIETIKIEESDFAEDVERLLKLVRSAIFCFVLCVRIYLHRNGPDSSSEYVQLNPIKFS